MCLCASEFCSPLFYCNKLMRIVFRNFTRLLSSGAFNADEQIEPMSVFKWQQLLDISTAWQVCNFIENGILNICATGKPLIPAAVQDEICTRATAQSRDPKRAKEKSITAQQHTKKFSCFYLNKRYSKLVFNEIHSIDTSTDTVTLINLLIDNVNCMFSSRVNLNRLINLGLFLRNRGDRIDFVKADSWIHSLKLDRAADIIGTYLIIYCGFNADEIPFLRKEKKKLYDKECRLFCRLTENRTASVCEEKSQGFGIDTEALKHTAILPVEAVSRYMSSIIRCLSNIEE